MQRLRPPSPAKKIPSKLSRASNLRVPPEIVDLCVSEFGPSIHLRGLRRTFKRVPRCKGRRHLRLYELFYPAKLELERAPLATTT
eukprot:4490091-Pyramimonas_sp.AAC.1